MLRVQEESHNITEEYVGILNYSDGYINAQGLETRKKTKIYLSKKKHFSQNNSALSNGDILHIFPDGNAKKIYTSNSNDATLLFTEDCNHNCIMCAQANDYHKDEKALRSMNQVLIDIFVKKKVPIIGISGGEPTLKLNYLIDTIKYINRKSPKTNIEILTNATGFSNKPNVEKLIDNNCRNVSFHIPLYSDSEKKHNEIIQKNNYYKAIKGIYNLAQYKFPIEIRNVVTKLNYLRLRQWAEFIGKNFPFCFHIAIMGLELTGNAKKNIDKIWIEPEEAITNIKEAVNVLTRADLFTSIYNYPLCMLPKELRTYYVSSISDWKQTFLPECDNCSEKSICCGIFNSCEEYLPVKAIEVAHESV